MSKIEDAVSRFVAAAIEKGSEGGPKDHELYDQLKSSFEVLVSAGEPGLDAFRALAKHESPDVRGWAASTLLARGETGYVFVLEGLVRLGGMRGFSSEMVLQEWREGRLGSPL